MSAPGPTAHFTVNTLALKRGGLVKAVMNRASTLAEHGVAGEVWIDVLAFQPRLQQEIADLKAHGHLHRDVKVRSILLSLDDSAPKETRKPLKAPTDRGLIAIPADHTGRTVRYFRDGIHQSTVRYDRRGVISRVDHFDPDRRLLKREETDGSGRLVRVQHFPASSATPSVHRYIGRDGRCFLSIWLRPDKNEWGSSHVFGRRPQSFANMGQLYRFAFERVLARESAPVLCSEFREHLYNLPAQNLDDVVRSVRHDNLRRVAVAHSSHLSPPYRAGSRVSVTWRRLLDHIGDWDALTVWTEAQREELIGRVGHADRIFAVPPTAPPMDRDPRPTDPNRLILVARTHPKKRVDEAIRVFHRVLQGNPEARLEIFGFGYQDAEEAKVSALIDELDVADRVRFMPFTKNPKEIYRGACATILTSASEGFGLVLLESMAHGVPVVAYDSNYGPRDVIVDGENGYLVPFEDNAGAADRVLRLMRDPALRKNLGEGAYQTLSRFGLDRYLAGWRKVLTGTR